MEGEVISMGLKSGAMAPLPMGQAFDLEIHAALKRRAMFAVRLETDQPIMETHFSGIRRFGVGKVSS